MAFTKFATIIFLVGFLTAQTSCVVTPACYHSTVTETTTTTETATVRALGAGALGAASAMGVNTLGAANTLGAVNTLGASSMGATALAAGGIPPAYYNGVPNYYNNGLPVHSRTYPFYNAFGNTYNDLLTDYDVNRELAAYSYRYNIPGTSLLNMYNLIHETMPTLSPQSDLNMIRSLAEAWNAEQLGYAQNYRHPLIDELYIDHLHKYVPSNYPRSYMNTLGFLDSRVPRLSDSTYNSIYRAIYDNTSSEYMSRVEYLNFALGTSMRYMSFNYAASWSTAF